MGLFCRLRCEARCGFEGLRGRDGERRQIPGNLYGVPAVWDLKSISPADGRGRWTGCGVHRLVSVRDTEAEARSDRPLPRSPCSQ